ncbi:MAG: four-carbon acid sugar kinase family protein [Mangrovibacterium sp.]
MIAVIADDFTGAAEIGGMGLRRGLKVIIETAVTGSENADLLVIATNTRSMTAGLAKREIEKVTRQLLELSPEYIFKKLDSVLRGHIYEELVSQQMASGKKRVIIVPANPNFNRIIKDGIYYVNGIPLSKTSFANDPEFPVRSSDVEKIIGGPHEEVRSLNRTDRLPEQGMIIGNVISEQDLNLWADKIDGETIAAGGSGFFDALLRRDFPFVSDMSCRNSFSGRNVLFIFGSTYPKETIILNRFRKAGTAVINLPEDLFLGKAAGTEIPKWAEKITGELRLTKRVAVATVFPDSDEKIPAGTIREVTGHLIGKVFGLAPIDNLFIEGGATAFQILTNLGIRQLIPFRELAFGIIQMHVPGIPGLCITTKPGSYLWPDFIINNKELN